MRPLRWSLRAKVFAAALTVCLLLVGSLTAFFGRASVTSAREALDDKANNYGKLASKQLEPVVEFGDHDAAREILSALMVDHDVAAVALFAADGSVIEQQGNAATVHSSSDAPIRSSVPVISPRGARGQVVIEMSLHELGRRRRAVKTTAATVVGMGILLALLVAWAGGRYLTFRLSGLVMNATSVARGQFDALVPLGAGTDEIGELKAAFGVMTTNLKQLIGENERRAIELGTRNEQMRTLLDHVAQGFLTIDGKGQIGPERSASVERWFGALPETFAFKDLLARADEDTALWFELAWEAVQEGALPREVAIAQVPKTFSHEGRIFELEVTPIEDASDELACLVGITDVTERLERERGNATSSEVMAVLERALEDRSALVEFLEEGAALVDGLVRFHHSTLGDFRRAVHTLKGTCALFGLSTVATFCHELETRMAAIDDMPAPSDMRELAARWSSATSSLARVFAKTSRDTIEVSRASIDELVVAVSGGASRQELARRARLLRLESMSGRLARISDSSVALAARLHKQLDVAIDADGVRFDTATWAPFWSAFTHVLRNAVDHGIEDADERTQQGKPRAGRLSLSAAIDGESFVLRVSDDGRGIDWPKVARRAATLGIPSRTPSDLEAALFFDGLSSKDEISEVSGRGIGLGAVRSACHALRGRMRVSSVASEGTTFRFVFPLAALGDAYVRAVPNRLESSVA